MHYSPFSCDSKPILYSLFTSTYLCLLLLRLLARTNKMLILWYLPWYLHFYGQLEPCEKCTERWYFSQNSTEPGRWSLVEKKKKRIKHGHALIPHGNKSCQFIIRSFAISRNVVSSSFISFRFVFILRGKIKTKSLVHFQKYL